MVLPQETSEWLEQVSMAVLRSRLLKRLRAADNFGRLHLYFPILTDPNVQMRVHSKVCFIDDRLLRVGSANLNNRSMGLDTECDLAVEAASRPQSIPLRTYVTAYWPSIWEFTRKGGRGILGGTFFGESHRKVARGQSYLGYSRRSVSPTLDEMVPAAAVIDPERPLSPDELMQQFIPMGTRRRAIPGLYGWR